MSGRVTQSKCAICNQKALVYHLLEGMCINCIHDELERVRKEREEFKAQLIQARELLAEGAEIAKEFITREQAR